MQHPNQQPEPVNTSGLHPFRTGYCDGLFGRECKSPFKEQRFSVLKNAKYIDGYMAGEEARLDGAGRQLIATPTLD